MLITIQVTPEAITFNGLSLTDLIKQAVKEGVEEASKKKEDPLEMVALSELAKKFGCSLRTMSRKSQANSVRLLNKAETSACFAKMLTSY